MKTKIIDVHPEFPDAGEIAACAKIIRQGGLVIFPTETVYGVAADFTNAKAVERLKAVKKRSDDKPFSILIAQKGLISNYTASSDPFMYKLIETYWPGPLTIVVPLRDQGKTIGIRMPDHPIAIRLIADAQVPLAAPSANFEGNPPPKTCEEALKDLDGLVDAAINAGPALTGRSSTVVDLTKDPPVIIREGDILQKHIDKLKKKKSILFVCTGNSCRSVMAEYLLKKMLKGRDDVDVYSAGTGVLFRTAASSETVAVLREEGIDSNSHLAQPLNTLLLKKSDLIITMTRSHRQQVLERVPDVEKRVYLLKEFANIPASLLGDMDVPDPIGKSHGEYKECLNVIKQSVARIKELI